MPLKRDNTATAACTPGTAVPAMRKLYDRYFSSHDYKRRYPAPNPATMRFLLAQGHAATSAFILDVGCGDGRYALALLDATAARITGCDISGAALAEFAAQLHARADAQRVRLLHGEVSDMVPSPENPRHDLSLLLFGVLSHAGNLAARVGMLQAIRRQTTPGGRLLLTVPSIWRRRPVELVRAVWRRALRRQAGQAPLGDIEFVRVIDGQPQAFFYHLYSVAGLKHELALAGWTLQSCQAESLLPEWLVTQHPWVARLDGLVRPLLPAALGYGIRAVAQPTPGTTDKVMP